MKLISILLVAFLLSACGEQDLFYNLCGYPAGMSIPYEDCMKRMNEPDQRPKFMNWKVESKPWWTKL